MSGEGMSLISVVKTQMSGRQAASEHDSRVDRRDRSVDLVTTGLARGDRGRGGDQTQAGGDEARDDVADGVTEQGE